MQKRPSWQVLVIILGLLILATQLERAINNGTFFGYRFRAVQSSIKSSALEKVDQPSQTCDKATAEEVSKILGSKVTRIGGSFADREEPTLISVCTYRTEDRPSRSVTIVIRDGKDEEAAKQTFNGVANRQGSEAVDDMGDEAVYSSISHQIVVRSKQRISTVTVGESGEQATISSKDAALALIKEVL